MRVDEAPSAVRCREVEDQLLAFHAPPREVPLSQDPHLELDVLDAQHQVLASPRQVVGTRTRALGHEPIDR